MLEQSLPARLIPICGVTLHSFGYREYVTHLRLPFSAQRSFEGQEQEGEEEEEDHKAKSRAPSAETKEAKRSEKRQKQHWTSARREHPR